MHRYIGNLCEVRRRWHLSSAPISPFERTTPNRGDGVNKFPSQLESAPDLVNHLGDLRISTFVPLEVYSSRYGGTFWYQREERKGKERKGKCVISPSVCSSFGFRLHEFNTAFGPSKHEDPVPCKFGWYMYVVLGPRNSKNDTCGFRFRIHQRSKILDLEISNH